MAVKRPVRICTKEEHLLTKTTRLPKAQRREQLLATALLIVRQEGTDALTLARLAERAGVTKPIAYEHFGTREGLLVALFRQHDDRTSEAVAQALSQSGQTLAEIAAILSAAYIDSCLSMGPEITAIFNALSASAETNGFRQSWREFLVEEFRAAFSGVIKWPKQKSRAVLLGLIGAAEILSEAAGTKEMTRATAVQALTQIMVGAIEKGPK
jgi:AcrR family transcriptional regulator